MAIFLPGGRKYSEGLSSTVQSACSTWGSGSWGGVGGQAEAGGACSPPQSEALQLPSAWVLRGFNLESSFASRPRAPGCSWWELLLLQGVLFTAAQISACKPS